MKKLLLLLGILFMSLFSKTALSQCSNFVSNYPSGTFSTSSATLTTVSTCVYGGDYAAYNVTSGNTYTWTTCGNSNFNTQLSL